MSGNITFKKYIPSHLNNTCDFLTRLHNLPPSQLKNLTFFTADVEALYTNISTTTALDDLMELASEHKSELNLYGLKLCDIHELFELTLGNSYFVYNQQVFIQIIGLFMGYRPSPYLANVRMYKLEKNSIYIDLRLGITFTVGTMTILTV